jgi:transcriptional regulator with XRE-family HTH domain
MKPSFMNAIGSRLRGLREETQMSVRAFGEQYGFTYSLWSDYENDRRKPNATTIEKLCRTFGVSADWIIGCDLKLSFGTYFIEAVGVNRIKIGAVVNDGPEWRMRAHRRCLSLNIGSPVPLRLILATTRVSEKSIHNKFARFRVKGEWFDGAPELWCFIDYLLEENFMERI